MILRMRDGEMGRRGDKRLGRGESGYALLLIFAMAATFALMLYVELPRVAFEKQRDREQVLIQHGEQYKRAIQLYFRKFKNYPPTIEALENTNNVRFLRRRYPDPLTGKDEWRLIHVGPGGIFTDSLTQKPKVGDKTAANLNTFITEAAAIGSALPDNQRGAAGPPRRASEGGQPQPGSDAGASGVIPGQIPGNPSQPGFAPGQPGASPGQTPLPGALPMPGSSGGSNFPPGLPGGVGQPTADPSQSGDPAAYNPGATTNNQQGMSAADLIGNLLRQPRPMPTGPATGGQTGMTGGGLATITGGIAGVASRVEKLGIKIYNERSKYNEWEFIYDFSKDKTGAGRMQGAMGSGDPRLAQQQGGQGIGGNGLGQSGNFGALAGTGGQAGFGGQGGAAGGFGSSGAASGSASGSGGFGGGVGSGFGGSVGSGFGSQPPPATPGQAAPAGQPTPGQPQPAQNPPQQQPVPQPGPIAPPPAPPPPDQTENPPQ